MTANRPTFIYFLRPIGADGPVKIGCSMNPKGRLSQLMEFGHSHLEIVATLPGGFELERNLHECFLDTHSHREWFNASPRLAACIAALQAGKPIHEAVDLSKRLGTFKPKPRKSQRASEAWTERQHFNAIRRKAPKDRCQWPVDIDVLMTHARRHDPFTEAQRARIKRILADPSLLVTMDELLAQYASLRASAALREAA